MDNSEGEARSGLNKKGEATHDSCRPPQRANSAEQDTQQPSHRLHRPQAPQPPPHPEPPPHLVRNDPSHRPRHQVPQPEASRYRPRRPNVHVKPVSSSSLSVRQVNSLI